MSECIVEGNWERDGFVIIRNAFHDQLAHNLYTLKESLLQREEIPNSIFQATPTSIKLNSNDEYKNPPCLNRTITKLLKSSTFSISDGSYLHVRKPLQPRYVKWPLWGWHIDKHVFNRKKPLKMIGIVHTTNVKPNGGGTAIIRGSHAYMQRFYKYLSNDYLNTVNILNVGMVVISSYIAWLHVILAPQNLLEITANAGDIVLLNSFTIHSLTKNSNRMTRATLRLSVHDNRDYQDYQNHWENQYCKAKINFLNLFK